MWPVAVTQETKCSPQLSMRNARQAVYSEEDCLPQVLAVRRGLLCTPVQSLRDRPEPGDGGPWGREEGDVAATADGQCRSTG